MAVVLLFAAGALPADDTECSRMAFGELCLGGPREKLPSGGVTGEDGIVYKGNDYTTVVFLHENRVKSIVRKYNVATLLQYRELSLGVMQAMDRLPDDGEKEVPDYCKDDRECEETAIRLGKGQISSTWKDDNFVIKVVFDHKGLFVYYFDTALMKAAAKNEKPRF